MPTLFPPRRLTSLIVSVAILLNLCAPALSQAVNLLAADALAMEICRAGTAAAGKNAPATPPAHNIKHCTFCSIHGDGNAPPPAAAGLLAVLAGHDRYPARPAVTPRPATAWPAAQPRAPPAAA
jgi:hypothetical protein